MRLMIRSASTKLPTAGWLRQVILTAALLVLAAGPSIAGATESGEPHPHPPSIGKDDKCPVCGMLVYRYPDFLASVTFADRQAIFFDGAKDLFKYLLNRSAYDTRRTNDEIVAIYVTEYYDMVPITAQGAFFVVGSDVLGPMGHELIPFRTVEDARQFQQDLNGHRILTYKEITPSVINQLDR